MQLRSDVQLVSIIKAMNDVVIPAIDSGNDLAAQQAQLIVGLLQLMRHQLPVQFRFDRDELRRLIASAQKLSKLQSKESAIADALLRLATASTVASSILERCTVDPAELTVSVRDMREATSLLMLAAGSGADEDALSIVEKEIIAMSREQLLRDRSLMLVLGWEADPALIPPIESLLSDVSAIPKNVHQAGVTPV